jgi:predicted porin
MLPILAQADLTISGQVNRMVANVDNGDDSNLQFLDNSGSGTRIRLKGERDTGTGIKAGFYWETQYESNQSSKVDAGTTSDFSDNFTTRHRDMYLKGGFGKVSLGQGNGAANGITEFEYSGTNYLTGSASPEDMWGSVTFGNSGGVKVKDVIDGMDALSRNDRLRYDTPKIGPVTLSLDTGTGGKTEFAVRFETKTGFGKLKGGIGSWDQNDAGSGKGTAGSIAYLHGSGFNAAYTFASTDKVGAADAKNSGILLGYKTGPHAIDLRLNTTDDKTNGVSADSTELGYVNRSLKGVEMYAGYRTFSADIAATDDIKILFAGARVKF